MRLRNTTKFQQCKAHYPVFVERACLPKAGESKNYPLFFHPDNFIFLIGKNKFDRLVAGQKHEAVFPGDYH
ncbi:MAG: hypothetical protein K9H64_17650 [Bacteroidales bacterium]|nr:hypothetical protein [Bacteroidales bacterium]MCF8457804.1 hypothetical protein [Bacteroidales bacterium]